MKRTKQQRLEIEERKNAKLLKMVNDEREKVAGYEQVANLHVAYIAYLLRKLGATTETPVTITKNDVAEAMKLEVRGVPTEEGFKLYIKE